MVSTKGLHTLKQTCSLRKTKFCQDLNFAKVKENATETF